jgi:mono/diheme cytochrome c family protein
MNSDSKSSEELSRLTSEMLDGGLSPGEMGRLAELLQASPDAHREFVRMIELHSMLEAEPAIQASLSDDHLPDNVVSLAGGKSVSSDSIPSAPRDSAASGNAHRSSWWIAAGIAAALAMGAFSLLRQSERASDGENATTLVATKPAQPIEVETPGVGSEEEKPEKQYERAVLATLGSGSQQRPPTNFTSEPSAGGEKVSYNRDIRPILSDNCFSCHGPDEHGRKADLRLDTRDGAFSGETVAVVAGKPDESELIARILTPDPDDLMPPPESHKKLTPAQIELLSRWVEEGAEYEEHWAFLPITDAAPEDLKGSAIDFFVDEKLKRVGLTRVGEADRRTLIRRATLDLTGLPPTPEEVAAFVANDSPDAYEKLVDELLARPAFGEHRARYWLDAARYGDTHGLHLDNYREMWPYRDWVINAFNDNMPFDQFTIEQIAGDLLPNATQSQQIATGFNRCNVTTSEGGAIEEEFLVRYAVDRVATTGTVWMGLTAGCAQCHDHKFDPMTMKDFYSLFAFFNNTTQPGMDGNAKDSPPIIRVYDSPEQEARANELRAKIAAAKAKAAEALKATVLSASEAAEKPGSTDLSAVKVADVTPELLEVGKAEAPADLGAIAGFGKSDPFTVSFRYQLPETDGRTLLARSTDEKNHHRGWRVFWEDRGIVVELIESYPGKVLKRGITRRFRAGSGGHFAFTYDGSGNSEGIRIFSSGAAQASRFTNEWFDSLESDFRTEGVSLLVGGKDPDSGLTAGVSEFHVANRRLADAEIKSLADLPAVRNIEKKPAGKRSDKEKEQLKSFLAALSDGPYRDATRKLATLETELAQIESLTPTTLVMAEKTEAPKAYMLERGEYDKRGEEVAPSFPEFLPALDESLPMNRLGLAKWLVHPEHPLTARVTVNRIWQEMFGVGLVKTSEDFGTQGENPSHPALLDWLASALIESGWDVKQLYRTILLSETYRQDSKIPEGMAKRDPENRLLARGPRFRLDAEVIRDQALFASGLLDASVGGPSVKPYQPGGIWEAVGYTNSNTQTFYQDFGPSAEHRRSLYSFWKRTAHPPNLAIFDAPNRESCVMRRERTNTPLQALVLMNDPQYVRASRYLALRVIGETEDRDERLEKMAVLLRGRPLEEEERRVVINSLDQFQNMYGSDRAAAEALLVDEVNDEFTIRIPKPEAAPELAAWTMVANQILNLDEVITKN